MRPSGSEWIPLMNIIVPLGLASHGVVQAVVGEALRGKWVP